MTHTSASSRSPLDERLEVVHEHFLAERPSGADEDVHMVAGVVDQVIDRCSEPDGLVLDPFAGFGTTLVRAIGAGRRAVGVELLPERVELLRARAPQARVMEGDARELLRLVRGFEPPLQPGSVDLVLTSPPYMTVNEHPADPLTGYELDGAAYGRYLSELSLVAAQCAVLLRPGGYIVWNVADLYFQGRTTHLIDDCSRVLERHVDPVGVTELVWDRYPHDLVADALLVFQRGRGG